MELRSDSLSVTDTKGVKGAKGAKGAVALPNNLTKSLQCSSRKATMIDLLNNKFHCIIAFKPIVCFNVVLIIEVSPPPPKKKHRSSARHSAQLMRKMELLSF